VKALGVSYKVENDIWWITCRSLLDSSWPANLELVLLDQELECAKAQKATRSVDRLLTRT
jgi:hypothetical protein